MSRKTYIGASFTRRIEAADLASFLRINHDNLFEVVSSWHDEDLTAIPRTSPECIRRAERDWNQITSADIAIFFIGDNQSGGGRHTEFGIALLNCAVVICIGDEMQSSNPFELLPKVMHYKDVEDFLNRISILKDFLRLRK
jgi:hypothetical protein